MSINVIRLHLVAVWCSCVVNDSVAVTSVTTATPTTTAGDPLQRLGILGHIVLQRYRVPCIGLARA